MAAHVQDQLLNCIDLLLDAVFLVDADGRVKYVNAACERIFGYTPDELIGCKLIDLVLPEERARTLEEAARIMAGQPRVGFVNRYRHKDGRPVHVMWSARWSEADQLRIGVARDVTAQQRSEAMQAATYAVSEAAHDAVDLDTLFPTIHAIIAQLVPVAGLVVATCKRESEALHFPYGRDESGQQLAVDEQLAHHHCQDVIASRRGLLLPAAALAPEAGAGFWLVVPLLDQTDPIGALMLKAHADTRYSDKDRELLGFVSAQVATAIERSRLKAELLRAARYDELTGLPNRRLFHDRIDTALARSRRKNGRVALLYLDIDDFKGVNDTFGHAAGDEVLRELGRRLHDVLRASEVPARLGGDEFVVLVDSGNDLHSLADRVMEVLREPYPIADLEMPITVSIGIAEFPAHGRSADALINAADSAMYRAKRSGRDRSSLAAAV